MTKKYKYSTNTINANKSSKSNSNKNNNPYRKKTVKMTELTLIAPAAGVTTTTTFMTANTRIRKKIT